MLRRVWKPVAATVAVGTPAYLYYRSYYKVPTTFSIPIKQKGPDGKTEMGVRELTLLSKKEADIRVRENAISETSNRSNGILWKYTTAFLPSNDPIEDAHANQIIERDASDPSAPGDYLFFSVMDGHGGYQTSQLLSKILTKAVALELASLVSTPEPKQSGTLLRLRTFFSCSTPIVAPKDANPNLVSAAIRDAFVKLDSELIQAPLRILANNMDKESWSSKTIPDLSKHPLALTTMLPAISGSCALMAVFDTAHEDLYIACTGDSRAVAGVWEPSSDGNGSWRIEVLSEDQTGRNPSELRRVRAEHPKEEEEDVIRQGRILGGLEPSRAFGDARYKWPRELQETLNKAFMVGSGKPLRNPPALLKTPPYVTVSPVVTHRKMSLPAPDGTPSPTTVPRFLVLATDGLWDQLSNEDVVSLVAGHLTGLKGTVSKADLPNLVPTSSGSQGIDGKNKKTKTKEGSWAFVDDNVSSHLIRNAFGGGDDMTLRRFLSIPAPHSRRYRDDITVTVICWEEGKERDARIVMEKVKSKL